MLDRFLKASCIMMDMSVTTKRELFEQLAKTAALQTGIPAAEISVALQKRERLGSTSCGGGIALPHALIPGLLAPFIMVTRLTPQLQYNRDCQYVDLIGLLLVPPSMDAWGVQLLAHLKRSLQSRHISQKIRHTQDPALVLTLLTDPSSVAA